MPDLSIITDAITDKAKADAKIILDNSEQKRKEIIAAATESASTEAEAIKKEASEKVKNIGEIAETAARRLLATDFLMQKSKMIESVTEECKQKIYLMDDSEYNKLLIRLLKKYAHAENGGSIAFCDRDKARLTDEFSAEIKKYGLQIEKTSANIKGGFILKYEKIDENCSIEEIFRSGKEKATDFLNKELFG